jgi:Na+(H+)/acetate symporter ActP
MKKKMTMALIGVTMIATPALAAGAKYYVEQDTVGNCSVVDSKPSANAGMTILGNKDGYASKAAAKKFLNGLPKDKCAGIVG